MFQDPDRQIFAGGSEPRSASVRGTSAGRRRGARRARRRGPRARRADRRDRANPYDLGYSRRKLLALASILAIETPVVVLDEPTTGQDARGVERVQRVVAELAAAGRTVVAISHDMRFVAEAFERVVVMRDGRIVLDGSPAEVFGERPWPTLASTFLEPPLAARVGGGSAWAPRRPTRRCWRRWTALELAATGHVATGGSVDDESAGTRSRGRRRRR